MRVWRLSVCVRLFDDVWRLAVAYIGPKSRTERPRKTKIGTEVAHVTRDSDTTFKVKGQLALGWGILWRHPARTACFKLVALNAALRTDYFRTEEVLNIGIGVQRQTDFLCQVIKRYTYPHFNYASCLLL